jgi:two-component system cell cycle sensor histidine kinase/response regulator CckA
MFLEGEGMPRKTRGLNASAYRALIDYAPDGILVVDGDGRIVRANAQAEQLFGYGHDELLGQSVETLVPVPSQDRHRKQRDAYAHHPDVRLMQSRRELRGRRKDGSEFPAEIGLGPVETSSGTLVCCIVRNSQRTEQALRASEVRYRRVFETAQDGILILDAATGNITDVNPFLVELLGYSRDDLLGKCLWEIGPFQNVEASRNAFLQLQDKKYIRYDDLPLQHKDGRKVDVEFISNVYEAGGVRVIQCNIRDTSARKHAEETLRQREEWYRELFEEDSAGNYVCTADGQLLACNAAFLRMFGFTSLELARQTGLLPLYPRPETRHTFLRRLKEEKKLSHYEEELQRLDGTPLQVLKRAIGTFDSLGELTGIHVQVIDESERQRTAQQLRQAQKMDAVGRLAGGVAHDFNNLLGVIIGQSELLSNQLAPVDSAHLRLREISNAAHHGASLTQQLLAYTRQQVLEPQVLDVTTVVADADKMLRHIIGEDVELVLRHGKDIGRVKADPNQLLQVILNLAVNSRDAMPDGGRLTIETASVECAQVAPDLAQGSGEPCVLLRVSDTGIGMSQDTLNKIFEPFFTTKGPGKGTGLGLSTVYGIVQQSGGQILVQSQPGFGTTFEIYLPRVVEKAPPAPEPYKTPIPRGTETILVVEDSPELRDIVRQFLEISGYKVLVAETTAAAERAAAAHPGPIDLLLTDVVLPGGANGRVLAGRLQQSRPETRVLFMSGYADDAVLYHAGTSNALHFLSKPFTRAELLEKVREVLNASAFSATNTSDG